jgi:hypothetical protein
MAVQNSLWLIDGIPWWQFILRVLWITAQLSLVLWIGKRGALFFYQGF